MPPDLIVLLCDTARADAFSPWGGPHHSRTLERLCREGIMFSSAHSPAPWTVPSIASLFSGKLPTEHGITGDCFEWVDRKPTSPGEAVRAWPGSWLPETLRYRGYQTWGASCNSWMSVWGGFDRGFDAFVDLRPWAHVGGGGRRIAHKVRRVAGRLDRGGRDAATRFGRLAAEAGPAPLFVFVDLMETHAPLDPPIPFYPYPPWRRFKTKWMAGGPDQGLSYNAGVTEPQPGYVATLRRLYFASARYEDHILARFIGAVEDRGRPSVVVVVADHGENLGEHGLFNHNSSLHQTLVHVPLVVWGHKVDLEAARVDRPTGLLGLGTWLVGLAEGDGDGRYPDLDPDGAVVSEYEGTARHNGIPDYIQEGLKRTGGAHVPPLVFHPGVAIRMDRHKYVATADGAEWLYDVESDPAEDRDLASARPDLVERFRPHREAWEARRRARPQYQAGDVAEGEIAEHLKELGYIE